MYDGWGSRTWFPTNKQMKVVKNLPIFNKTRGVSSHCRLAILDFKRILRQKRNYGKTQIFHHAKIYLIFKKSCKRN
jgi:hypothetical protein